MSALGIFIYGVVVMLFVGFALGLLAWGILTEWRQEATEEAGSDKPVPASRRRTDRGSQP
jgi:hypothetical protein